MAKEHAPTCKREIMRHADDSAAYLSEPCTCADSSSPVTKPEERQRIICLCGSTRFIEQFAVATWELELTGAIVLGCTLLPSWFCGVPSHFGEATGTKEQRDWHHLRKIDLADEVLVLDIGGYIGESTRNEIAYAIRTGKPVRYVSRELELLAKLLPSSPPEGQPPAQAREVEPCFGQCGITELQAELTRLRETAHGVARDLYEAGNAHVSQRTAAQARLCILADRLRAALDGLSPRPSSSPTEEA